MTLLAEAIKQKSKKKEIEWLESSLFSSKKLYALYLRTLGYTVIHMHTDNQYKMY